MNRRSLLWTLLILCWAGVSLAETVSISSIEQKRDRGFDYLDIYSTGNVKVRGLLLEDRLLIDFTDAEIDKKISISRRSSKRIADIQAQQIDRNTVRIVIKLKANIDYEIVNVFGRGKSVIEICDRVDQADRIMAAWEKANLQTKGQALKSYKFKAEPESKDRSLRGKVVVIDPGHGGSDPGAISPSGMLEKNLTLQAGRKAARLLNAAGATVYLTRNEDRRNNLPDIVSFANRVNADIFISIHFNFADNRSICGTETYYYNRSSRRLALILHQALLSGIKRKDRGLRRCMFYAIHHTEMPAVLIEPVYLTNDEEERLAASSYFQQELAEDILRGVKAYFRSKSD